MKIIFYILLLLPFSLSAQLSKKDSLWLPFKNIIGKWDGVGEGPDGKGNYDRRYQKVLNKNYIEVRNKAIYPPSEKSKNGYNHEDIEYISYDKSRKTFVFRQFHIEGYINQYKLESISDDQKTFIFISESIENIPTGWRAKEVYTITDTAFTEIFYLAEPGKDFEQYSKAELVRKK